MAKRKSKMYSSAEKQAWKRGFFSGLFSKKKKPIRSKVNFSEKKKKRFGFSAFNDNCDIFNVISYGVDRKDALKNARKKLKRDPEIPSWGVTITDDKNNSENFRNVTVYDSGKVFDNWTSMYRRSDDKIRAKYKDLSQPVKH